MQMKLEAFSNFKTMKKIFMQLHHYVPHLISEGIASNMNFDYEDITKNAFGQFYSESIHQPFYASARLQSSLEVTFRLTSKESRPSLQVEVRDKR